MKGNLGFDKKEGWRENQEAHSLLFLRTNHKKKSTRVILIIMGIHVVDIIIVHIVSICHIIVIRFKKGLEGREEGFCLWILQERMRSKRLTILANLGTVALLVRADFTWLGLINISGAIWTVMPSDTTMVAYSMQLDSFVKWEFVHCSHCLILLNVYIVGRVNNEQRTSGWSNNTCPKFPTN